MLFFAAGQFDRVEQHAAQGLSRWQAHLLAIFLCRRLSARRGACAKIRQTMPCPAPTCELIWATRAADKVLRLRAFDEAGRLLLARAYCAKGAKHG